MVVCASHMCTTCSQREKKTLKIRGITSSHVEVISTQKYLVHQTISLVNQGDNTPTKQNLWVALIHDFFPYQEVISRKISPDTYALSTDEYGNLYAEFNLSDHPIGSTILIEISHEVAVNEIEYDLSSCKGELPKEFTQPELHIESNNLQVTSLADELSDEKYTACEQVRAFYDYAGDKLIYNYNHEDWGAQATFGVMGSDCTEYSSLMIALSRAEGIPARYFEGLVYLKETDGDANNEDLRITHEHAWLDVYLPGIGWTAMDPAMGRLKIHRETYFAYYMPNHIIITTGRNPSTLRGASYWTHLYWPGNLSKIYISDSSWDITPIE